MSDDELEWASLSTEEKILHNVIITIMFGCVKAFRPVKHFSIMSRGSSILLD